MAKIQEIKVRLVPPFSVVSPGDTLVVGIADLRISEEGADLIKNRLRYFMPDVTVVVVPASALIVYRPDAEKEKGA